MHARCSQALEKGKTHDLRILTLIDNNALIDILKKFLYSKHGDVRRIY